MSLCKPSLRRLGPRVGCAFSTASTCDVLIVGGGVVGSSAAYHLAERRGTGEGIVVLERDPSYRHASAVLSAGGIRQQFSLLENIQMSLYSVDFLHRAPSLLALEDDDNPVDLQFREDGYLFLASTEGGRETLQRCNATQRKAGVDWISLQTPEELATRFPWLATADLAAGSLGIANEGWFDPWALLNGMRRKAVSLGVRYIRGEPRSAHASPDGGVGTVAVAMLNGSEGTSESEKHFAPRRVVNAAGAWSQRVQEILAGGRSGGAAVALPVSPRKRCVFFVNCPGANSDDAISGEKGEIPLTKAPLTVDPSGVYFRPCHADNFICGVSPTEAEDEEVWDPEALLVTETDHEKLFEEKVWPALYNRVGAFGELKVQSSWAGLYEYNTLDQNAVIGFHPHIPNQILCSGFSGHGLQHSPAAGRAVAELIDCGKYETLDLGVFGFERVLEGRAVREEGIV